MKNINVVFIFMHDPLQHPVKSLWIHALISAAMLRPSLLASLAAGDCVLRLKVSLNPI